MATPFGRYAVLVDGAPEIMLPAGNLEHDFIEMPFVAGPGQPSPDEVGELPAEITASRRCPCGPRAHCRIVSWQTSMPRKASISSGRQATPSGGTMRRLSGKRGPKGNANGGYYSQTV